MERKIASPAHRLVAYLIDQMVCVGLFVFLASKTAMETDFYRLMDLSLTNLTLFIYFLAFWPLLNALLISKFGGTIGKLLTGTRIEANGHNLSFLMAIFRNYVGYLVSGTIAYLGFFWILVDEKRQGWHDMMAGSVVTVKNKNLIWIGILILLAAIYFNFSLVAQIALKIVSIRLY